ncbi:unnamed protein product [Rotaria magnacalcarata]|uniref:F-box domain-containing protein n=2 Tax=Rotaria magnacalcarata TaxID=392030 RepID=A0A814XT78_9BILA|nr:unnamed protein product [Rotaria magnacalcarata]CAF4532071.1 unnamed protein product [Rotaria magnacalcarata]
MSTASLDTLPSELLYRILSQLDVVTIFGSLYHACTRLRAITNAYDRYKLNFTYISKREFTFVSKRIRPENIISLKLHDGDRTPGQIELFLSIFHIDQFIQLRSLTVRYMDRYCLNTILTQASSCPLESVEIKTRDHNIVDSTLSLLETILAKTSLIKLDISMLYVIVESIPWPNQCSIQHLRIGSCTLEKYKAILRHSPHLRTFNLKDCSMKNIDGTVFTPDVATSYDQLTSLTFRKMCRSMEELQSILVLTPSLTHLKLINDPAAAASYNLFDGARWEWFIEQKLSHLKIFEFFFSNTQVRESAVIDVDSLVSRFQTPFWLDCKQWFIACNFIPKASRINLYSLPVCETLLNYNLYVNAVSRVTSLSAVRHENLMKNVRTLRMNLTRATIDASVQQNEPEVHRRLFQQTTELRLIAGKEWSLDFHKFLSVLIDLSRIVRIMLGIDFDRLSDVDTVNDIRALFEQTCNLRSLEFPPPSVIYSYEEALTNLCSIVPNRVKHLQVPVRRFDDMKIVIEKLDTLSSVSFHVNGRDFALCQNLFDWLTNSGRDFSQRQYNSYIQLWLGKKM